jgi:predicted DNA-binding transcriptional regulator YafY
MRPADRLFLLVQLLRGRSARTAASLAEELGVSKRTVYRDVADLVDSGVPIEGEAGVGYRLQRGYELPPMTLTPEEIEALALGMRMVEAWGDPEIGAAARAVLTKVESVLPAALRPSLRETALFAIERPVRVGPELATLRRAVAARRKLRLVYGQTEVSERVVRPLGLYYWGTTWTLAAWCELRGDYRNFRPDRIRELEPLPERFDPDDGPSLSAFLAAMRARTPFD